jgi:hypothetical protein
MLSFDPTRVFAGALLGLLIFLGAGCATSIPYKQKSDYAGYYSRSNTDGTHVAFFEGPGTNRQRYADFSLLHAAELTAKAGFKYLVVLDQNRRKQEKRIRVDGQPARREKVTESRPNGTTYERTVTVPATRGGFIYETWEICSVTFMMTSEASSTEVPSGKILEAYSTINGMKTKYRL